MSDTIIIDTDEAQFIPVFGPAIAVVKPGKITASGPATHKGKKCCIKGDEKSVEVPGVMYIAGGFVIPGTGTLKIQALGPLQTAKKTKSGGKSVILKGVMFDAVFEVQQPAQQPAPPAPPIPDPTPKYMGKGLFASKNTHWKGT